MNMPTPSGHGPAEAAIDPKNRSVRISWDTRPDVPYPATLQDAQVIHAYEGSPEVALTALSYMGPSGKTLAPVPSSILFNLIDKPFTNWPSEYKNTASVSPALQIVRTASGAPANGAAIARFTASSLNTNAVESPDYGSALVAAWDSTFFDPPFVPEAAAYVSLFEVRFWAGRTAKIRASQGVGQNVASNSPFRVLWVTLTDSVGSMRATHGMRVRFHIERGNARWEQALLDQRYVAFSDDNTTVTVLCDYGYAISPRLIAGAGVDTVIVVATADMASEPANFYLSYGRTPATDPDVIGLDSGFSQDRPWKGQYDPLTVKALTRTGDVATTGNVIFQCSPGDGGGLVLFDGQSSVSVPVSDGAATASGLIAYPSPANGSGYSEGTVLAYPAGADPSTPGAGATFYERVWSGRATVVKTAGDGATAGQGQPFTTRLAVTVLDLKQNPVPDILVRFQINTTRASFSTSDPRVRVDQWLTDQEVIVRVADGRTAYAPIVLAGVDVGGGKFTVTASTEVSAGVDFNLSILANAGEGQTCAVNTGDWQDQVLGQDFEIALAASVKDSDGNDATSGLICFSTGGDNDLDASGSFSGQLLVTAPAQQGLALAPALRADSVLDAAKIYGTFLVSAYPQNGAQSPGQVATFTQRVWRSKAAVLTAVSGNGTTANPGEVFPPLVAGISTPGHTDPIQNMLVTFTLEGPGKFTMNDAPGYVSLSDYQAVVRSDQNSQATSPPIVATGLAGTITVTANAVVASAPLPFQLTVEATPDLAVNVYTAEGDFQDSVTGIPFQYLLEVDVRNADGEIATKGNVVFKIYPSSDTDATFSTGGRTLTVAVKSDGTATALPLTPTTTKTGGNGVLKVVAYPKQFSGDPETDNSTQTAHFTARVWPGTDFVAIATVSGTPQSADMDMQFEKRLVGKAFNQRNNDSPLGDYLMRFEISDGAVFDVNDPAVHCEYASTTAVVVRTNDDGTATAPRVIAGSTPGPVTVVMDGAALPNPRTPTNFNLTVTQAVITEPYFVAVASGNFQDADIQQPYPLALSVTVKDQQNNDAESGEVTFKIFPDTASNLMFQGTSADSVEAAVTNGEAVAPTVISGIGPGMGPGLAYVVAFPKDYKGTDPLNDTSGQTARFTLRTWMYDDSLGLAKQHDNQTASPQAYFADRLQVLATDTYNQVPLPFFLMTFTIDGDATFEMNDADAPVVSWHSKQVLVQGDENGVITAPRILAGETPGAFTVTAQGNIQRPLTFNLTIQGGQGQTLYLLKPTASTLRVPADGSVPAIFNLIDIDTHKGKGQQPVTMTIVNTGSSQASFKQGDPTALTAGNLQTDTFGEVSATVYGNGQAGTATLTASNPNAADYPLPVRIS